METFIYADKYYYKGDDAHELSGARAMDMRTYVLGDKYDVTGLKTYAHDCLSNSHVLTYGDEEFDKNVAMIHYAYTHSPPRDEALKRKMVREAYWTLPSTEC